MLLSGGSLDEQRLSRLVAGVLLFYFISTSINSSSAALVCNRGLIHAVPAPVVVYPVSTYLASIRRSAPALIVVAALMLGSGAINIQSAALVFAGLGLVLAIVLGLSLAASVVTVLVPDTTHALPIVLRVALYASPILYAPTAIPDTLEPLTYFVPTFWAVEIWSAGVTNSGPPNLSAFLGASVWAVSLVIVGYRSVFTMGDQVRIRV